MLIGVYLLIGVAVAAMSQLNLSGLRRARGFKKTALTKSLNAAAEVCD